MVGCESCNIYQLFIIVYEIYVIIHSIWSGRQRFSKGKILHSLSISSTSKCKFKMKKQY